MSEITFLGKLIKELRKKLEITQADLIERSGLGKSTIENIESGKNSNPEYKTVSTIFRALGCSSVPITPIPSSEEEINQLINDIVASLVSHDKDTIKVYHHVNEDMINLIRKVRDYPNG